MSQAQDLRLPKPQNLRLQSRDYALLAALSEARILPVEAIEWLLYPDWRRRYRAHVERGNAGHTATYYPSPNLYRRLRLMRELTPPLITCIPRVPDDNFGRLWHWADSYTLTRAGARALAAHTGCDSNDLAYDDGYAPSTVSLAHRAVLGCFYAGLRAQLEHQGRTLDGWCAEWRTHRAQGEAETGRAAGYDRLHVAGHRKPLPALPDATFTLDSRRFFVELDYLRRPMDTWRTKINAYEAYRGSAQLRERYGVNDFTLLVVVPSWGRRDEIARLALTVRGGKPLGQSYRFLQEQDVHPTRIRLGWVEVAGAAWSQYEGFGRRHRKALDLPFNPVELWPNP